MFVLAEMEKTKKMPFSSLCSSHGAIFMGLHEQKDFFFNVTEKINLWYSEFYVTSSIFHFKLLIFFSPFSANWF